MLTHFSFGCAVVSRCGAAVGGEHEGELLGESQTAGARGAVEGGRLYLLPVCGRRAALHRHGLQTKLPEPRQDPRRVLPLLWGYEHTHTAYICVFIRLWNINTCETHWSTHHLWIKTCRHFTVFDDQDIPTIQNKVIKVTTLQLGVLTPVSNRKWPQGERDIHIISKWGHLTLLISISIFFFTKCMLIWQKK